MQKNDVGSNFCDLSHLSPDPTLSVYDFSLRCQTRKPRRPRWRRRRLPTSLTSNGDCFCLSPPPPPQPMMEHHRRLDAAAAFTGALRFCRLGEGDVDLISMVAGLVPISFAKYLMAYFHTAPYPFHIIS